MITLVSQVNFKTYHMLDANSKRIIEIYCGKKPSHVDSLFVNGVKYSMKEITNIVKEYCQNYCQNKSCLMKLSSIDNTKGNDTDEVQKRHIELMKSFKMNIRDLKDMS